MCASYLPLLFLFTLTVNARTDLHQTCRTSVTMRPNLGAKYPNKVALDVIFSSDDVFQTFAVRARNACLDAVRVWDKRIRNNQLIRCFRFPSLRAERVAHPLFAHA